MDGVVGGKTEKSEIEGASQEGILAHCAACKCERLFVKRRIRHPLHLLAAILSGGLWLIGWLAICIKEALRPWRCKNCGWRKPDAPLQDALQMGEAALQGGRRQSAIRMIHRDYVTSPLIQRGPTESERDK